MIISEQTTVKYVVFPEFQTKLLLSWILFEVLKLEGQIFLISDTVTDIT